MEMKGLVAFAFVIPMLCKKKRKKEKKEKKNLDIQLSYTPKLPNKIYQNNISQRF